MNQATMYPNFRTLSKSRTKTRPILKSLSSSQSGKQTRSISKSRAYRSESMSGYRIQSTFRSLSRSVSGVRSESRSGNASWFQLKEVINKL